LFLCCCCISTLPVPAAGDVSDSRYAVRLRLKCCAELVGILTLHLTELPRLRKRREEKRREEKRREEKRREEKRREEKRREEKRRIKGSRDKGKKCKRKETWQ